MIDETPALWDSHANTLAAMYAADEARTFVSWLAYDRNASRDANIAMRRVLELCKSENDKLRKEYNALLKEVWQMREDADKRRAAAMSLDNTPPTKIS